MNVRRAVAIAVAVGLAGFAGRAVACGDGPAAENLVATPSVKAALRNAYLEAHRQVDPAQVSGPLPGRTYYGSFGGDWYAVATFAVAGRAPQPAILMHHPRWKWHVVRETHGGVCARFVPEPLIAIWYLERWRGTSCFVEP
jgi:hypothetical protein